MDLSDPSIMKGTPMLFAAVSGWWWVVGVAAVVLLLFWFIGGKTR